MNHPADTRATLDSAEYLDYRRRVGDRQLLWENNGWSVRGTWGGQEALLWVSGYLLKGFPGGPFALDSAAVNQSMLVTADPDGRLGDNDFLSRGWSAGDLLPSSAWRVEPRDGAVVWSGPGRTIVSAPPAWHISGDHAGIEVDLDIAAAHDAVVWLTDPRQDLEHRQDRWFLVGGTAGGQLAARGAAGRLDGHAVHERHIHLGTAYDPVTLLRTGGVTWHTGHSAELSYAVLARPAHHRYWGMLTLDGHSFDLSGADQVRTEVTATWPDPRTGTTVPSRWSLRLSGPFGTLQVDTTARARAFYCWDYLTGGSTLLYWWLCSSRGTLHRPAGGTRTLTGLRSEAHLNRTVDDEWRIR
ncbi:MAG TPA: hypothetical protein VFM01_03700 [Nakamurella sp.]|jgi:hypothetical protein|nr:hypothetical protein [Nakamurella sp.]